MITSFTLMACNKKINGGGLNNLSSEDGGDSDDNSDSDDCKESVGCTSYINTNYRKSCLEIIENTESSGTGTYLIYPYGSDNSYIYAMCDMETDGGGWTKITINMAKEKLKGAITQDNKNKAKKATFDKKNRPYTEGKGNDDKKNFQHTANYQFEIPFGYSEFFLTNYKIKSNSKKSGKNYIKKSKFIQSNWTKAYDGKYSDIAFGPPDLDSPFTSFATYIKSKKFKHKEIYDWPNNKTINTLDSTYTTFQISWGAEGSYLGWYPWWDGSIWVR